MTRRIVLELSADRATLVAPHSGRKTLRRGITDETLEQESVC